MRDDCWDDPEPPRPADPYRGMRRLAQAVLVQAAADFKTLDPRLRRPAEQFLYPNARRREDLRLTIQLASVGATWMEERLAKLKQVTPPIPDSITCDSCHRSQPPEAFQPFGSNEGYLTTRCRPCTLKQARKRKAAREQTRNATMSDLSIELQPPA